MTTEHHVMKVGRTVRALGACAMAAAGAAVAQAQPADYPYGGAYAIVTAGRAEYKRDCGLFGSCDKAHASAFKLGAGYRFGVTSVEAWYRDFGKVSYGLNQGVPGDLQMRSIGAGVAWTARLGQSAELTTRLGAAQARVQGSGRETRTHTEPYVGLSLGWRATDIATLELGVDYDRGRMGDSVLPSNRLFGEGHVLDLVTPSLGVRLRF